MSGSVGPWVGGSVVLILALSGVSWLLWGAPGALATAVLGAIAAVIQLAAGWLMKPATSPRSPFPAGWLAGTALRLLGVVIFALLVVSDRKTFAPLPSALGFLGVLIPLLMMELRRTR